jgi:hypothetical protein
MGMGRWRRHETEFFRNENLPLRARWWGRKLALPVQERRPHSSGSPTSFPGSHMNRRLKPVSPRQPGWCRGSTSVLALGWLASSYLDTMKTLTPAASPAAKTGALETGAETAALGDEFSRRLLRSNNRMMEASHDAAALILLLSEGLAAVQKFGGNWEDDEFAEFLSCGFSSLGLEAARKLYLAQLDECSVETPNQAQIPL